MGIELAFVEGETGTDLSASILRALGVAGFAPVVYRSGLEIPNAQHSCVVFGNIDAVSSLHVPAGLWGIVVSGTTREAELTPDRANRWAAIFRSVPFVIATDRDSWNYSAGWLVQAGRVPRGDEIILLHPENLKTLAQRVGGWAPAAPAFHFPEGLVSARPSLVAVSPIEYRSTRTIQAQLTLPEDNVAQISIPVRVTAPLQGRATFSWNNGEVIRQLGLSGEEMLSEVLISVPEKFRRRPGVPFKLELRFDTDAKVGLGERSPYSALIGEPSQSLAVRFYPGPETKLGRFAFLFRRACTLLRQGDYRRFWTALRRRLLSR